VFLYTVTLPTVPTELYGEAVGMFLYSVCHRLAIWKYCNNQLRIPVYGFALFSAVRVAYSKIRIRIRYFLVSYRIELRTQGYLNFEYSKLSNPII